MNAKHTQDAVEERLIADSDLWLPHKSRPAKGNCGKEGREASSVDLAWPILLRFLAMCGFIAILALVWTQVSVAAERHPGACDCGESIIEAKSKGCEWDSLAGAWLPERCRDPELTAQFTRSSPTGSWTYYADESKDVVLNETQVSRLAEANRHTYWVTVDWHVAHCLFYWKKSQRSAWSGKLVEERYSIIDHINHCEELIWRWRDMDGGSVVAQEALLSSEWHP
jgi:hypothetical protein